ncbi:MAG: hypothetical protein AAFZ65_04660, partial [Planctomycetota bacterium]
RRRFGQHRQGVYLTTRTDAVHREELRYGHVVHAWSTYAYAREEGAEPLQRGVNSYQLWFDDERWWVVSILWDSERDDQPLPAEFLPGER